MDKYKRVDKPRSQEQEPIHENEVKITTKGKMRSYIAYAQNAFGSGKHNEVILKAMGRAINKTITIAEILKRRVANLHQVTSIDSTEITDLWEPIEEGLDRIETTRHVSSITITLSTNKLDEKNAGYQPPIPADQVKPQAASDAVNGERRGRRGGRRGFRGSRRGFRGRGVRGRRGGADNRENQNEEEVEAPPRERPNRGPGRGGNRGRGRGGRGRGRGGFRGDNQGGFRNENQGGFRNENQGGFRNENQGGYRNENQGGYRNENQGGYRNDNQGGYRNENQGGDEQGEGEFGRQFRGGNRGGYRGRGNSRGRGGPRGGRGRGNRGPRGGRGGFRGDTPPRLQQQQQ